MSEVMVMEREGWREFLNKIFMNEWELVEPAKKGGGRDSVSLLRRRRLRGKATPVT